MVALLLQIYVNSMELVELKGKKIDCFLNLFFKPI